MKSKWFILICLAMLVLSACNSKEADLEQDHSIHLPNGDIQEKTNSAEVLPSFLDNQSNELKLVYQAAGNAHEILEWIPCYCGCAESAGHLSNKNCFIDRVNEDGSVVWDDHGTRCLVCVEIAVQSINMAQDGNNLTEIRNFIDQKYKEGYAPPTSTPMPS
ncbi:PCYCGC motif-containing (lipo)protein [Paenisporosarcina sp. TG20]|uniref:PCYCGC motif-containing (lipo)protein n=1 Tax=Paenisporosarcina sp. TG20 TaxID=1211706 RepID=UPI0002EEA82A|nr:PCYCGC motif-containing (lipo)protein [Paenisporosarcina sp. TG20]